MQVAHAEDSTSIPSTRTGKERQFKTLLTGADGALDNFRVYFVRQQGEVDVAALQAQFRPGPHAPGGPRQAELWRGQVDRARRDRLLPGRDAVTGPSRATPSGQSSQFGGASRSGFISSARAKNAMEEMKEFGSFREGHLQARRPARARRKAQPGRLRGGLGARQQAQARLSEAALRRSNPDEAGELRMGAVAGPAGLRQEVALHLLGAQPAILDAQGRRLAAAGWQLSRGGIQIGFVVQGSGAVNGEALRKHSAFSGREDFALTSDEGMEVLLVGLPVFAEATQETLVAAE